MMRLDVHEAKRRPDLLLVDCQSRFLDHLDTRFVVPLVPASPDLPPISRLHPTFVVLEREYLLLTHQAAAVPMRELGAVVANLSDGFDRVGAAINFLLHGF